jgi:hypothetical protein
LPLAVLHSHPSIFPSRHSLFSPFFFSHAQPSSFSVPGEQQAGAPAPSSSALKLLPGVHGAGVSPAALCSSLLVAKGRSGPDAPAYAPSMAPLFLSSMGASPFFYLWPAASSSPTSLRPSPPWAAYPARPSPPLCFPVRAQRLLHGRCPAATPSSLHPPPPTPATNPPSPAGVLLLPAPSQGAQKIPQPSPQAAPSLLPWRSPVEAPCRHPLFLLSLPAPSPKQQVLAPPTSPMENSKAPPRPGVLAAQLGLASLLSGQPSRCSTARTTCSTICATGCVWSCWCFAQRLRDATDLRSAYESSSKPAVSSLLPRAFCVRLKGRTNESHNKLCNDCVCRLIAALVDVTPCASLVGKEPKLMACMRDTSRPGCSPCMIAIYFTYVFVDDVSACLYACENKLYE